MFHKTQFSEVYISSSGRENFELKVVKSDLYVVYQLRLLYLNPDSQKFRNCVY